MKDIIIIAIVEIVKWTVVLVVAGAIFYNVYPQYPKYSFIAGKYWIYKCNTQTGSCDKAYSNTP